MTGNEAIMEARRHAGITQVVLAERLGHHGQATVSMWERKHKRAESDSVFRVLEACGMTGVLYADGWQLQPPQPSGIDGASAVQTPADSDKP